MIRLDLQLHKFGTNLCITNAMFEASKGSVAHEMECRLTAYICAENQPPYRYYTPLSWWQMFKEQWFPKWLLRKYPVKKVEHLINLKTVYPFLRTEIPPHMHGDRIQVLINDQPLGMFMEGTEAITPIEEMRYKSILLSGQLSGFCPKCHKPIDERFHHR